MSIDMELSRVLTLLLVSVRTGMVFVFTPVMNALRVPAQIKLFWVLGFTLALVAALNVQPVGLALTIGAVMQGVLHEAVIGAALAFGVLTAFASLTFAGRIIDMQMGFGIANLIDPVSRTQVPLLGSFMNLLAVVAFFGFDGHHLLLRGLAFSLQQIPPGGGFAALPVDVLVAQFGAMFVYAVALIAPVVVVILLIDIALAIMSRTMPQVNVFIVGIPLKIVTGLFVLALTLNYQVPVLKRLFAAVFTDWQWMLTR